MPYRFELSSTSRAGCKGTKCKKTQEKILKGELRMGSFFQLPEIDHGSWSWKHWGCVTPKQVENVKKEIDGDTSLLDGVEELPEEDREKILRALDQGHVDDEDWRDDPELNRPGAPTRTSKKAKAAAEDDDSDDGDSKKKMKKKGAKRAKANDEDEGAPAPKRKRKTARPSRNDDSDAADDNVEEEAAPKRKRKSAKDKAAATEDDGVKEESAPKRKRKSAKNASEPVAPVEESAEELEEASPKPHPKKQRGKAKAIDSEAPVANKAAGRKSGKNTVPAPDHSVEAESAPQKTIRPKKQAGKEVTGKPAASGKTKNVKDQKNGESDGEVDQPKPKGRARKKA